MGRPKLSQHVVRLSVSLDEPTRQDLCALADALGVSTAWAVRRSVTEWVQRNRNQLPAQMSLLPWDFNPNPSKDVRVAPDTKPRSEENE